MDDLKLPHFPVVTFLVRWGGILAVLAGLAPVAGVAWLSLSGAGLVWLPGGLVVGAVLWLFVQSYIEVLRLLADALMPR